MTETIDTRGAKQLADALEDYAMTGDAWTPVLTVAAAELRNLHAANLVTSYLCTKAMDEVRQLTSALAAAEARNATLTDDAAALRLAVENGMTLRFWGQACAQATAPGGPAAYVTANYHGDKMAAARDAITRAAAIIESGGERQRLQSDAARAAASISTKGDANG